MNTQLLIDTLTVILDRSQSEIEHILRKSSCTTAKMRYVTLNLTELKYQLIQWVGNAIKIAKQNYSLLETKLEYISQNTLRQLSKLRLHTLLKSKVNKFKKNSLIISTFHQSNSTQYHTLNEISQLEQSVIMMEKDLNIGEEDHEDLGVSAIIQKSKNNLFQNRSFNLSTISDDSSIIDHDFKSFLQHHHNQFKPIQPKQKTIPIYQFNLTNPNSQVVDESIVQKPITTLQKVMKKKKKVVQSAAGSNMLLNKQGLLGNLLEETYQQHCLQNQTS